MQNWDALAWGFVSQTATLLAGTSTIELIAIGNSGPNIDYLQVTSKASSVYEAEDAAITGPHVFSGRNSSDNQYVDYVNPTGDSITWTLDAAAAGDYLVELRYALGAANSRSLELNVNGGAAEEPNLEFVSTGSWNNWEFLGQLLTLQTGENTLSLTATGQSGPNLDLVLVSPDSTPEVSIVEETSSIQVGLYDTSTDDLITVIQNGDRIPASIVQGRNLTIAAIVPGGSPVESIVLNLNNGDATRSESSAPYALYGDRNGDFFAGGGIPLGQNRISILAYFENGRNGTLLESMVLDFEIVDQGGGNTAPTITSPSAASVSENQTRAIDVNATDDKPGLTYSLTGGADVALFDIDSDGIVSFTTAPDFEALGDVEGDRSYELQVTVTDADEQTDVQNITVTVTDVAENTTLREIVADKFPDGNLLIGATTGQNLLDTPTGEILDREFSYVTPENDFKQTRIHPDNSTWRWDRSDAWIEHIAKNNQVLRMHGPIGPQASSWAKEDSRTAAELEQNMRDFVRELGKRYGDVPGIIALDVVNETIENGRWVTDKPGSNGRELPWYKIGQDSDENKTPLYIKYAFEEANQHADNLKLIFNQHEKPIQSASWDLIKETITYLRDRGLRVDGIGWQAHLKAGWELDPRETDSLRDLIDWAHQNNLEFHITEQTVAIDDTSQSELEKQAATYRAIIEILLEKSSAGIVGWNTWKIDDGTGWRPQDFSALFDRDFAEKPAYYAIYEALTSAQVQGQ